MGTRLVTSYSCPVLGGVYKLTALNEDGKRMVPKIKRSDDPEKITNPGLKRVVRIFDPDGQMRGDVLFLRFHNPHQYHVSLSPLLFKIKQRLLRQAAAGETTTSSS